MTFENDECSAFSPDVRDLETNPYSADEQRVAAYLFERTGIGAGDDPIGVLMANNVTLAHRLKIALNCLRSLDTAVSGVESDCRNLYDRCSDKWVKFVATSIWGDLSSALGKVKAKLKHLL